MAAGFALALSGAAPGQTSLAREGRYWTQTANGNMTVNEAIRLRVIASGNVTLRGHAGGRMSYTLKRKIQARDAEEAARLLRGFEVKTSVRGGWLYLTVTSPSSRTMSADLSVTVPRSFEDAVVESYDGNVQAYDFDGQVQVSTAAGNVSLDRLQRSAVAKTGGGNITVGKISGALKCYSGGGNLTVESVGAECWLETEGGEITVGQAMGPVHVFTQAGGNIKVGKSTGAVYARTAGGLIEIGQAAGVVEAQNSGGSIQVNSANVVRCQSDSGAIRLKNVDGALRASTVAGNIIAELLAGRPLRDSMLSTNSGDITVLIPSNIAVTVMARNQTPGSGRIISEFPEIQVRQPGASSAAAVAEGALNGGGPVFRIVVNAGTIYLKKK